MAVSLCNSFSNLRGLTSFRFDTVKGISERKADDSTVIVYGLEPLRAILSNPSPTVFPRSMRKE